MNPLLQLACFQMLLYGGMWLAAWAIVGEERRAVLHWLAYSLMLALALGLVSLRPDGDPWLTVVGANLVFLFGFAALGRGTALFLRLPTRDREQAALLVGVTAAVFWMGPSPEIGPWRHPGFMVTGLIGWLLLSTAWRCRKALVEQFGARAAAVALLPLVLTGALQVYRCLGAWLQPEVAKPMHVDSSANHALVYLSLFSAALFNLMHLFLIVLRLLGRLTYLAEHDMLTGLLTRRAMQALLEREWLRWRQLGEPFTLVSVDLDHFKQINDRWGHQAGDEVLRSTAGVLRGNVRSVDSVGRVGGEEFLVLMPGCTDEAAEGTAQRLRQALGARPMSVTQGDPAGVPVTASLGVAAVHTSDADLGQLMRRADAALYRAKRDGRDRVVVAAPVQRDAMPADSPLHAMARSSATPA